MNDEEKAKKRFAEWEHYALEDEQIIKIALKENGPPNQICLHAEQMAEKYLKGFLAFHKNMPMKTHEMDKLISECSKYDKSFSRLSESAILLNEFYLESRYPGDIIEFSLDNAQEGYIAAKTIKDFVLSKIANG